MSTILIEKKGHVAIFTLNRPEALNALNSQMLIELDEALDYLEDEKDIYVAVLTGAGRAFVAGADISEMSSFTAFEAKAFADRGNALCLKLANMTKPVIAAVNGFALGGGCEITLACDIRLASENAKFGQPEIGLGIIPGFGGTQRLSRIIGVARAMEMILTSKPVTAQKAKEMSLVNEVYPQEELMEKTLEMAQVIAAQAQIAVRQAKRCIRRGKQTDIYTGAAYEAEAFGLCFSTEDQKDAMAAFLKKEKLSEFKNR